jgi:CheY-like chemotaxis protein
MKVLVVDDSRDAAMSLSMLMRVVGHEVQTAYDGEEALDTADRFLPDVILLDLGMPKMDGLQACRHIRERSWGTEVVVIAVTGYGQLADQRRSHDAGFDVHLVKPVDPDLLLALLAEVAQRRRSQAHAT